MWLHIVSKAKEIIAHPKSREEELKSREEELKKNIERNPSNDGAYRELGQFYTNQGKLAQAEEAFKKAIELNPNNSWLYADFVWSYYIEPGETVQAEEVLKKAIELVPNDDRLYATMATLYAKMGKKELSQKYLEKADSLRNKDYRPITVHNYKKLKEILDRKKIKLVCVSYPMRSIEPLKKIFKGQEGIIFVDNEKIFKEALKKVNYEEYFEDMFGGDFGHCTPKGNRLLAENIANAILKEVFGR